MGHNVAPYADMPMGQGYIGCRGTL